MVIEMFDEATFQKWHQLTFMSYIAHLSTQTGYASEEQRIKHTESVVFDYLQDSLGTNMKRHKDGWRILRQVMDDFDRYITAQGTPSWATKKERELIRQVAFQQLEGKMRPSSSKMNTNRMKKETTAEDYLADLSLHTRSNAKGVYQCTAEELPPNISSSHMHGNHNGHANPLLSSDSDDQYEDSFENLSPSRRRVTFADDYGKPFHRVYLVERWLPQKPKKKDDFEIFEEISKGRRLPQTPQ